MNTRAVGVAGFALSADGMSISYAIVVANIRDVTMAHIHLGVPGENGPIVVFLYGPAEPAGRVNGVLVTGTFDASALVGPLADMTLDDLIAHMDAGTAYVNVHTVANPGGEIRGQIAPIF